MFSITISVTVNLDPLQILEYQIKTLLRLLKWSKTFVTWAATYREQETVTRNA